MKIKPEITMLEGPSGKTYVLINTPNKEEFVNNLLKGNIPGADQNDLLITGTAYNNEFLKKVTALLSEKGENAVNTYFSNLKSTIEQKISPEYNTATKGNSITLNTTDISDDIKEDFAEQTEFDVVAQVVPYITPIEGIGLTAIGPKGAIHHKDSELENPELLRKKVTNTETNLYNIIFDISE